MNTWLAVFIGGGAGSMVRYAISRGVQALALKSAFPWATLITNVLATGLLALLVLRFQVNEPGKEHWRALLAVGFCGGFSTFSAFSLENHQLLRDGLYGIAALNIGISITVGMILFHFFARTA